MLLVEFSMFPTDKGESVSEYVSQLIDIIDKSHITYQLTPMGTILEGEWDDVFSIITNCFNLLKEQSNRISCQIKMDYRSGNDFRISQKVEKIQQLLKRELNGIK